MRSSLARVTRSEPTEAEVSARIRHLAQRACTETGMVVIRLDDPRLDDWERQTVKNIAQRLYGVR